MAKTEPAGSPPKRVYLRKNASGSGLILQLFVFVFFPLSGLLLLVTFGSLALHRSAMRTMVAARDEQTVRIAAQAIVTQLETRLLQIEGLGVQVGLRPVDDLADLMNRSSFLISSFPGGLVVWDRAGRLLATTANPGMLDLISSTELTSFWQSVPPGQTAFSPLFHHPANGELALLAVSSNEGWISAGVLFPQDLLAGLLEDAFQTSQHTTVLVVDTTGIIIYNNPETHLQGDYRQHPAVLNAFAGRSGAEVMEIDGSQQIAAYGLVQSVGWALVVQEPAEMVETPLLSTTQLGPLVLVPALLIALLALLFGVRQVVGPLQALEKQAVSLAWGDFDAVHHPVGGISEIRSLQNGLIHLAEKVRSAQQSLHSYIGAITAGQEDERRRLARELHDDTLQGLIALRQRAQLVQISPDSQQAAEALLEVEVLAEGTIQELRRLIRDLRPIYLEDLGLNAALQMLCEESTRISGFSIKFEKIGQEHRQTPDQELAIYRIAQEALTNAVRHSGANHIKLIIKYAQEMLVLQVSDDGYGFTVPRSPAEFAPQSHFGLLGMHERAELIGARLEISSSPTSGTHLQLTLPVQTGNARDQTPGDPPSAGENDA